jgi:hypothetical protein
MTEPNLWIGKWSNLDNRPDDRLKLRVSQDDLAQVSRLTGDPSDTATVTDLDSGTSSKIRRADCGLDCRCAVELAD